MISKYSQMKELTKNYIQNTEKNLKRNKNHNDSIANEIFEGKNIFDENSSSNSIQEENIINNNNEIFKENENLDVIIFDEINQTIHVLCLRLMIWCFIKLIPHTKIAIALACHSSPVLEYFY